MTGLDSSRVSRVVGYTIKPGDFGNNIGNLPQRIAILGEGNDANQASFDTTPFQFTSAKQVGDKYGYGSPLYQIARILRPVTGNVVGGIPTVIYPQLADGGATATIFKLGVTVATTVTKTTTHTAIVNGRKSIDGARYDFKVTVGDDAATVRQSIIDAVLDVEGAPCIPSENVTDVDFTSRWKGASSTDLDVEIDTNGEAAGVVYATLTGTSGTGTVDVPTSLALFGEEWNTIVINPYGTSEFANLETFNGTITDTTNTGRYAPNVFKPFIAIAGSKLSTTAGLLAITDAAARKDQVTNVIAPAPNTKAFDWEAAANMAVTHAILWQDEPHRSNGDVQYLDMPIPTDSDIGDFVDYDNRDLLVKGGCSTVMLKNGKYSVQDYVTTYHPDGENPPKFRYARDLNIDWNYGFAWRIVVERDIQDNAIMKDGEVPSVDNTISLAMVKQLLAGHNQSMNNKALITDLEFANSTIQVSIGTGNPARLNVTCSYKRTSTANVVDTVAEVDFYYGG
jgi:phage tail sheath gpL-like